MTTLYLSSSDDIINKIIKSIVILAKDCCSSFRCGIVKSGLIMVLTFLFDLSFARNLLHYSFSVNMFPVHVLYSIEY